MEEASSEANKQLLVSTFQEITSSSKQEALFFLESHTWNLDTAVSTFFSSQDNPIPIEEDFLEPPQQQPNTLPLPISSAPPQPLIPQSTAPPMASRDKNPSKPSGSRTGGIRTLADLNRRSDSGSDSDSDGPQEYYTGGEKSGIAVQDPSKGNDVDSIFNQARQQGAMEGTPDHLHPTSSSRSFAGTGRLLSGESVPAAPQQPEPAVHHIVFWGNGFTVNNGPLRRLDDPENAAFLESIKKSECPKELEPADRSSQVHVNLTRRNEDCPEPEKHRAVFQGVGRTLGSSTDTAAAAEQTVAASALNTAPPPSMGLVVDQTLPSTSIQLRLADGTRMVARFNYHHTINDIRCFIDASRPGGPRAYQLQTVGFPPKKLTDVSQTIEQAGLANSVVIQKL